MVLIDGRHLGYVVKDDEEEGVDTVHAITAKGVGGTAHVHNDLTMA